MTIIYKLTNQNMQTYNGCQWSLNETKKTDGEGGLCGPGYLHGYTHPLIAVFLNPIHADIMGPRMFVGTAEGQMLSDHGLKVGYTEMTLTSEIAVPEITLNQKIAFGILCGLEVYHGADFVKWAEGWLNGSDRSEGAACVAARAARAARAAWAACVAADAACVAADAAEAAAREAARAAREAAARAAWAAWEAAAEAADAAEAAAREADIDLIALAEKAMTY